MTTLDVGDVCQYGVIETIQHGVATVFGWQMNRSLVPVGELQLVQQIDWFSVEPREIMLPHAGWAEMVRVWNCPLINENKAFSYLMDHKCDMFIIALRHGVYGALTEGRRFCISRAVMDSAMQTRAREPVSVVPGDFVLYEGRWHRLTEVAIWKTQQPTWTGRIAASARALRLVSYRLSNGSGMNYRYEHGRLVAEGRPPLTIKATADGIVLTLF